MADGGFHIALRPGWWLTRGSTDDGVPLQEVLALLSAIDAVGHIAGACRACGLSYRHGWGVLRRFEAVFGTPLLVTRRRQGTELSPFAQRLLWANRRIEARLMPMLDSLASELQEDLERLLPETGPHLRLHASHGFAVEALMQHISAPARPPEGRAALPRGGVAQRQEGSTDSAPARPPEGRVALPRGGVAQRQEGSPFSPGGVELRYRTATEALASLNSGECDLAGFQVPQGDFETAMMQHYAQWLDPAEHLLIHLAVRNTGLFVTAGNPKGIRGIADLARPDVRFVNRQIGSSTRHLIELMLRQLDIPIAQVHGYENSEFTHMAVAAHIASGMADAGIGVETAAHRFGLDFIPLARERYFFAIRKSALEQPAMQALLAIMRGADYKGYVGQLTGYDASETGRIQTVQEAFG